MRTIAREQADVIFDCIFKKDSLKEEQMNEVRERIARVLEPRFDSVERGFQSSNIGSISYDPVSKVLQLEFLSGGTYHFYGVPLETADIILMAESKGRTFHQEIKGKYPANKVQLLEM